MKQKQVVRFRDSNNIAAAYHINGHVDHWKVTARGVLREEEKCHENNGWAMASEHYGVLASHMIGYTLQQEH